MKNFHLLSLHHDIKPIALNNAHVYWLYTQDKITGLFSNKGEMTFDGYETLLIKTSGRRTDAVINFIENKWKEFVPDQLFEFSFLESDIEQLYRSEQRFANFLGIFTSLMLFVANLGLFGLISFVSEQRTKEIGIRKVLGATINSIVFALTSEFTKWVVIANIVAWPIAWYAMNKWLQNFAYQIEMSWWSFVLAGGIALAIAIITISWQAVKAAISNPIESLRYE